MTSSRFRRAQAAKRSLTTFSQLTAMMVLLWGNASVDSGEIHVIRVFVTMQGQRVLPYSGVVDRQEKDRDSTRGTRRMTAKRGFTREGGLLSARDQQTLYVGVRNKGREGCDDKLHCWLSVSSDQYGLSVSTDARIHLRLRATSAMSPSIRSQCPRDSTNSKRDQLRPALAGGSR